MRTSVIQCSVKDCPEQCSEQHPEHAQVPSAPSGITAGWVWFRPSFAALEVYLCPGHALGLHALLANRVAISVQGRAV